jgi:hypothetical protein
MSSKVAGALRPKLNAALGLPRCPEKREAIQAMVAEISAARADRDQDFIELFGLLKVAQKALVRLDRKAGTPEGKALRQLRKQMIRAGSTCNRT